MHVVDKLSEKLSLTRAEVLMVSTLLAFLVLGGVLRQMHAVELESDARQRAESAVFSDAEADSLLKLALLEEGRVEEAVRESMALEKDAGGFVKTARRSAKKPFTGTVPFRSATFEELQQIPGVGPVMARRLIDFREKHGGSVDSYEKLLEVKGIGTKKLEILKKHLILEQ
ncbi:helix-hairpin-helix domain-containing protein [Chlorobium sp. N1]|uniref:ComEA family DNA-binding protein n=1 Tax=Chlorobium sp. N1 TaxID=2491138 RepID=UPI0010397522|nr:helix-hairpin-helix domain-containing protein [Chlorobium sp. N1]TCD47858.1 helix-hairpin-helix domain-containing protein [Chlorobium sp. N1]